jgi:hypothetical protein
MGTLIRDPDGSGSAGLLMAVLVRMLSHKRIYGILEMLPLGLGRTIFNPDFTVRGMPRPLQRLGAYSVCMLEAINGKRRVLARIYREEMDSLPTPPVRTGDSAVYTRYPVLAGEQAIPKTLYRWGVRRMYPNAILDEPAIRPYCTLGKVSTPGAASIARRLITLPTNSAISEQSARGIARWVKEVYQ